MAHVAGEATEDALLEWLDNEACSMTGVQFPEIVDWLMQEMVRYITDELRLGFRMIPLFIRDPDFTATVPALRDEGSRSNKTPGFEVSVLFLVLYLIAS